MWAACGVGLEMATLKVLWPQEKVGTERQHSKWGFFIQEPATLLQTHLSVRQNIVGSEEQGTTLLPNNFKI